MAQIPLFKIGALLIKTASKPIANRIKHEAAAHSSFSSACRFLGDMQHYSLTSLQVVAQGHSVRKIERLPEHTAVANGADLLGDLIVFGVAAAIMIFEYTRSERKKEEDKKKKAELRRVFEELRGRRVSLIEKHLDALQLQLDRLEEQLAVRKVLPGTAHPKRIPIHGRIRDDREAVAAAVQQFRLEKERLMREVEEQQCAAESSGASAGAAASGAEQGASASNGGQGSAAQQLDKNADSRTGPVAAFQKAVAKRTSDEKRHQEAAKIAEDAAMAALQRELELREIGLGGEAPGTAAAPSAPGLRRAWTAAGDSLLATVPAPAQRSNLLDASKQGEGVGEPSWACGASQPPGTSAERWWQTLCLGTALGRPVGFSDPPPDSQVADAAGRRRAAAHWQADRPDPAPDSQVADAAGRRRAAAHWQADRPDPAPATQDK